MKYYVVADVHGFYSELKTALEEKGFFEDTMLFAQMDNKNITIKVA